MREVRFEKTAFNDLGFWAGSDLKVLKKIVQLIENIRQTPYEGLGEPEALKYSLKGYWSRRITEEHRLVYTVGDNEILIVSYRYHYS